MIDTDRERRRLNSLAGHTPGPWEAGQVPDDVFDPIEHYSRDLTVRPKGEHPFGDWVADCGHRMDDERVANARLIASAPILKAVLRQALKEIDDLRAALDAHKRGRLQ